MLTPFLPFHPFYILLGLFGLTLLIQLFYYWFFYSRLAFYRKKQFSDELQPVSVVICAHNEANNLAENLPYILEQDYPDFEVIVIDDTSTDGTREVLLELSQRYPHLKIITVSNSVVFFRSKKFPLSVGIKSAQHEILLLTDADCKPTSNQWIRSMQSNFVAGVDIVLGFSPYHKQPSLLNWLIRYDAFQTAVQYLSFALAGFPYMGVGRNLSYRKSLFYDQKGFIQHYKISSGDDDLFINSAARRKNTRIEINSGAHVLSKPVETTAAWLVQKRRHLTTGKYYKTKFKVLLGIQWLSAVIYYMLLVTLLLLKFYWVWVVAAHAFRYLNRAFLFYRGSKSLSYTGFVLSSFVLDPFFTFFTPAIALSNHIRKPNQWK